MSIFNAKDSFVFSLRKVLRWFTPMDTNWGIFCWRLSYLAPKAPGKCLVFFNFKKKVKIDIKRLFFFRDFHLKFGAHGIYLNTPLLQHPTVLNPTCPRHVLVWGTPPLFWPHFFALPFGFIRGLMPKACPCSDCIVPLTRGRNIIGWGFVLHVLVSHAPLRPSNLPLGQRRSLTSPWATEEGTNKI